jgi:8-oxo-dGTP pyrophosphatase MutT (NUDIX family)
VFSVPSAVKNALCGKPKIGSQVIEMQRQFTATVYILDEEKVLLIFHRKLKKWLPPGGHLEEGELPAEGAIREAKEETGLDIELILDEHCWIDSWNAKSFPRPYLCLLEEIPAHGDTPSHQHMDMIYLARPIGGLMCQNLQETEGLRWFSLQEVEALISDVDIFEETKQVIGKIYSETLIATKV